MVRPKKASNLFSDECRPAKSSELAIHSKKLAELKTWLTDNCLNRGKSYPKCLLLTGPSGSGKSTSLEVLSKELNIELVDYEPETLYDENLTPENDGLESLGKFLSQSGARFNPRRKILLVITNLPDEAYNDILGFRQTVSEALQNLHIPVIFCLSDVDSCWHLNHRRLFTNTFVMSNNIEIMKFNSVATTYLKKAIQRAAELLFLPLSKTKLEAIEHEANNDLRIAMNILQMNLVGTSSSVVASSKYSRKRQSVEILSNGKANKEDMFHMLGRILYAHRISPEDSQLPKTAKRKKRAESQMLMVDTNERKPLEHDVNDIIQMSSMPSEKILAFLHEHEPKFQQNLEALRKVSACFSECENMTSNWTVKQRLPDEYVAQVAARHVMFYNYGINTSGFRSLNGPLSSDLTKEIDNSKDELRRLPRIGDAQYVALTIPYLAFISPCMDPNNISCYLARPFNISWKSGRDSICHQMENLGNTAFFKKLTSKKRKRDEIEQKFAENQNGKDYVDEKIEIEESDYDSFDDM
ncbi:unnamed protein product [Caenorhabditis bovis]|uniref:Cell cycle checkpoint protein RAD17 n=1 Tax=Caenorhabditis bovis TaxID=2654633 RepID=A0A8S1FCF4_9PELO|nr:unnamed protein product [Caenorhabditis bovis]